MLPKRDQIFRLDETGGLWQSLRCRIGMKLRVGYRKSA